MSDGPEAPALVTDTERLLPVVVALLSALDRTETNFIKAVNGRPVRDMDETLAENRAAALLAAQWIPVPSGLIR
jgi:hypothetical protein